MSAAESPDRVVRLKPALGSAPSLSSSHGETLGSKRARDAVDVATPGAALHAEPALAAAAPGDASVQKRPRGYGREDAIREGDSATPVRVQHSEHGSASSCSPEVVVKCNMVAAAASVSTHRALGSGPELAEKVQTSNQSKHVLRGTTAGDSLESSARQYLKKSKEDANKELNRGRSTRNQKDYLGPDGLEIRRQANRKDAEAARKRKQHQGREASSKSEAGAPAPKNEGKGKRDASEPPDAAINAKEAGAKRQRGSRFVRGAISTIRSLSTDDEQLGALLEKVLEHPSMSGVRAAMPSLMEASEVRAARTALAIQGQQSSMLAAARATDGKKRGRASDDRRSFVSSVLAASSGTPTTDLKMARTAMGALHEEDEEPALTPVEMPSLRERARALACWL